MSKCVYARMQEPHLDVALLKGVVLHINARNTKSAWLYPETHDGEIHKASVTSGM